MTRPLSTTQRAMVGIVLDVLDKLDENNWIFAASDFNKVRGLFVADFLGVTGNQVAEVMRDRERAKSGASTCDQCRIIREHPESGCMPCVLNEGHSGNHQDGEGVIWQRPH